MISRVCNGHTASVIAYGARGSGKTYTIQVSFLLYLIVLVVFLIFINTGNSTRSCLINCYMFEGF